MWGLARSARRSVPPGLAEGAAGWQDAASHNGEIPNSLGRVEPSQVKLSYYSTRFIHLLTKTNFLSLLYEGRGNSEAPEHWLFRVGTPMIPFGEDFRAVSLLLVFINDRSN